MIKPVITHFYLTLSFILDNGVAVESLNKLFNYKHYDIYIIYAYVFNFLIDTILYNYNPFNF